ncbi:MAG TPA: pyridoxal phosphate-dependent aminotransferase [Thermodesulfobacteriota bacterium]|nr:pyridoxal phosphate-dependent aminotransferase [Thermodesulfobacteriota bacterium]
MLISDRIKNIKPSGVRRIFDMARQMKDPINLSIGEPDFDIPEPLKEEGIAWIKKGFNKYTPTQGIPELREKIAAYLKKKGIHFEAVMVTAGVTGGLLLSSLALIDPGDEVIIPDPFFVMYEYQVLLMGGVPVFVDTYPDFRLREEAFAEKLSKKTKLIIINSPNNPAGAVYPKEDLIRVVRIARERDLLILSDDIYEHFVFDAPSCPCIGQLYENTLTLGGFSKGWGMTGWRLGYAAGPKEVIEQMITLQQYTFSSVNSFAQKAAIKALDFNVDEYIQGYKKKRDLIYDGLRGKFRVQKPEGAFYIFPEVPGGNAEVFVEKAIQQNLFIVPGTVFSKRNTHVRISFAASDEILQKGIETLRRIS